MKDLDRAVLEKVQAEARAVVAAAEEEALRERVAAERRREARIAAERERRLGQAETEAARLLAQARMEGRNRVAAAKARVIEAIEAEARAALATRKTAPEALATLLREVVAALEGKGELLIGVAERDLGLAREILRSDGRLAGRVREISARAIEGGVVAETADGALMVDNSYAARLEQLAPRARVRFGRELF